jgi:hypothetical protein
MRKKKMYGEISKNWGEFHISSSISSRFIAGGKNTQSTLSSNMKL